MKLKSSPILLGLSACVLLSGCGEDKESKKQIGELQDRLLKLEAQVNKLEKEKQEASDYFNARVKQTEADVQKLIQGLGNMNPKNKVQSTQQITSPEQLKAAQGLAKMSTLDDAHKKMIALVKAYMRTKPIQDIPKALNDRQAFHPADGQKWDIQRLTRFIEIYKISHK